MYMNYNNILYVRDQRYIGLRLSENGSVIEIDGIKKTYEIKKIEYGNNIKNIFLDVPMENNDFTFEFFLKQL